MHNPQPHPGGKCGATPSLTPLSAYLAEALCSRYALGIFAEPNIVELYRDPLTRFPVACYQKPHCIPDFVCYGLRLQLQGQPTKEILSFPCSETESSPGVWHSGVKWHPACVLPGGGLLLLPQGLGSRSGTWSPCPHLSHKENSTSLTGLARGLKDCVWPS